MSYDLVISEHGDLVFGSNRDLAGISGTDLIEQRIKLRLKIQRGSWTYDEDGDLGSRLNSISSMNPDQLEVMAKTYAIEALQDLDEISIVDVHTDVSSQDITLVIFYNMNLDHEPEPEIHELQAAVPVTPIVGSQATTEV